MKIKYFNWVYVCLCAVCFLYGKECSSQNVPTTWQGQIEFMKIRVNREKGGDANDLSIINYTYKGIIGSEAKKAVIIDSMLSFDSPAVLRLSPVLKRDTVTEGDSCRIREVKLPKFEIVSNRQMTELAESKGEEDPLVLIRKLLNSLIEPGFEYLELEWDYKGKRFKSIGIVSNEKGGFIYEPIASNILIERSTTTQVRKIVK